MFALVGIVVAFGFSAYATVVARRVGRTRLLGLLPVMLFFFASTLIALCAGLFGWGDWAKPTGVVVGMVFASIVPLTLR